MLCTVYRVTTIHPNIMVFGTWWCVLVVKVLFSNRTLKNTSWPGSISLNVILQQSASFSLLKLKTKKMPTVMLQRKYKANTARVKKKHSFTTVYFKSLTLETPSKNDRNKLLLIRKLLQQIQQRSNCCVWKEMSNYAGLRTYRTITVLSCHI